MRNDFAIFIITHGRADNQKTLSMLMENGYTGEYYLVLDDQDDSINKYIENYGEDHIIIFHKDYYIARQDAGLEKPIAKFAVYARNAVEDIAKEYGYKYFMVFDDDIYNIRMRYDDEGSLKSKRLVGKIDEIFEACVDYVEQSNIACLTFGVVNIYRKGVEVVREWSEHYRLGVNCFLRNSSYTVNWRLNMSEDLITPIDAATEGQVWLTFTPIQIDVSDFAGVVAGGNTDTYKTFSSFKITFMPLLTNPTCHEPKYFGDHWKTVTHAKLAVPRIVSSRYRKV